MLSLPKATHPYFKYTHEFHLFHQCQSLTEYIFSLFCVPTTLSGAGEAVCVCVCVCVRTCTHVCTYTCVYTQKEFKYEFVARNL